MSERKPKREKTILPIPDELGEQGYTTGQEVVASTLSSQLGTNTKDLTQGSFDMRRLTVLNEAMQVALAYFGWRGGGQKYKVKKIVDVEDVDSEGNPIIRKEERLVEKERKGVRFWNHITDFYLNSSPSLDGRGRRQIIEMQRATTPGAAPGPQEQEKPGWIGRNITKRGWRDEQEKY